MTGVIGLLKSPKLIAGGIAVVALAALVWSWHSRGQRIETLEARLAHCGDQRAALEASAGRLKEQIAAQNEAVADLEAARKRLDEKLAAASERAEAVRKTAEAEITDIMARRPAGETELERCEEARRLLVRD